MKHRPPNGRIALLAAVVATCTTLGLANAAFAASARKVTTPKKTVAKKTVTTKKKTTVTKTAQKKTAAPSLQTFPPTSAPAVASLAPLPPASVVAVPLVPTTVAPPVTNAVTTTVSPATTTTAGSTTTTLAPQFDLTLSNPSITVPAGGSGSTTMLLLQKSPNLPPVNIIIVSVPDGITLSITPNPTTTGSEIRVNVAPTTASGAYAIRLLASTGTASRLFSIGLTVSGSTSASASPTVIVTSGGVATVAPTLPTTTLPPAGAGSFGLTVIGESKVLRQGETVTYTATVVPGQGFFGAVRFRLDGLPPGVSVGYSENPTASQTSIWLSSAVPLTAGSYPLTLIASTSTQTQNVAFNLVTST